MGMGLGCGCGCGCGWGTMMGKVGTEMGLTMGLISSR